MKLYGTTTSPYARIARVVVFEKHLQNNIEFIWIKTRIPNDPFLSINPSGRAVSYTHLTLPTIITV